MQRVLDLGNGEVRKAARTFFEEASMSCAVLRANLSPTEEEAMIADMSRMTPHSVESVEGNEKE